MRTSGEPSQSSFHSVGPTSLAFELPQLGGFRAVERDRAEVVVARADVHDRVAVGIDRRRALDDVARREVREDAFTGLAVDEVDLVVVRAEHDPRAAVAFEHRGLPGPPVAAPGATSRRPRSRVRTSRASGKLHTHLRRVGHRAVAVVAAGRVAAERQQSVDLGPPRSSRTKPGSTTQVGAQLDRLVARSSSVVSARRRRSTGSEARGRLGAAALDASSSPSLSFVARMSTPMPMKPISTSVRTSRRCRASGSACSGRTPCDGTLRARCGGGMRSTRVLGDSSSDCGVARARGVGCGAPAGPAACRAVLRFARWAPPQRARRDDRADAVVERLLPVRRGRRRVRVR